MSLICLLHDYEYLSTTMVKCFRLALLAIIICDMCMIIMYDSVIHKDTAPSHNRLFEHIHGTTISVIQKYIFQLLIQFYEKLVSFLWTSIESARLKYSLLEYNQNEMNLNFDCTSQMYETMIFRIALVLLFTDLNQIQKTTIMPNKDLKSTEFYFLVTMIESYNYDNKCITNRVCNMDTITINRPSNAKIELFLYSWNKLSGLKCHDFASIEHNIQLFKENSNVTIDILIKQILLEDVSNWIEQKVSSLYNIILELTYRILDVNITQLNYICYVAKPSKKFGNANIHIMLMYHCRKALMHRNLTNFEQKYRVG